jgi:hypothetical protein
VLSTPRIAEPIRAPWSRPRPPRRLTCLPNRGALQHEPDEQVDDDHDDDGHGYAGEVAVSDVPGGTYWTRSVGDAGASDAHPHTPGLLRTRATRNRQRFCPLPADTSRLQLPVPRLATTAPRAASRSSGARAFPLGNALLTACGHYGCPMGDVVRGLRQALVTLLVSAVVALVVAGLWFAQQGGGLRSKVAIAVMVSAALISLTGGTAFPRGRGQRRASPLRHGAGPRGALHR